jgi:hypothetical protein
MWWPPLRRKATRFYCARCKLAIGRTLLGVLCACAHLLSRARFSGWALCPATEPLSPSQRRRVAAPVAIFHPKVRRSPPASHIGPDEGSRRSRNLREQRHDLASALHVVQPIFLHSQRLSVLSIVVVMVVVPRRHCSSGRVA